MDQSAVENEQYFENEEEDCIMADLALQPTMSEEKHRSS